MPGPHILFADTRFVVLNKPAGLAVHPGPRGGPSVEDWFPLLSKRRDGPWLAHRLDADTAGCLVIALRKTALLEAQAMFAGGQADKVYWAVVQGGPEGESGRVDLPLVKRTGPTGWRMAAAATGQPAVTDWRVLGRTEGYTWLELAPHTGRTHQIRVHCAALGFPVLGDPVYGLAGPMLHLLARRIMLPLTPALTAEAPIPAHMVAMMGALGMGSPASGCLRGPA